MQKNKMIGAIIGSVFVVGIAFYGGTVYAHMNAPRGFGGGNANGQFTAGQRVQGSMRGMGGGFTAGQILSKDATSITIKMQDGSTKIVLLGADTKVLKTAEGSLDDLAVGTNVTVTGSTNSDKSVTASSVQIRPVGGANQTTPKNQ